MLKRTMKLCTIIAVGATLASCASKDTSKTKPKITHRGYSDGWNRDQIRRNQEIEAAQAPSDMELDKAAEEATNNCNVMTKDQMTRSKASGCMPLDERAGMGAGMYCCPKE